MNQNLFLIFVSWFFFKAPMEILRIGQNFLLWGWQYFSIGYFVPRLFSPWHRDITSYGRGFDLTRFLHVWGWNLISRFIGAVLRLFVMAVGLLVEGTIFGFSVVVFILWFLLPAAVPVLLVLGILTLTLL